MCPLAPKSADKQYVIGMQYRLAPFEERSGNSHSHYFAALNEAFKNLPEIYADKHPTMEHLRKWCLIKSGFREERSIACASAEEAERIAAFIKPIDDFAVVLVHESSVTVYTAQSQSKRAMGKAKFQASKQAVLDVLAIMLGTDVGTLKNNANKAA